MVDPDAAARVRLEGRAELLEATGARYGALVGQLSSFRWKAALRRTVDVLREVIRAQPQVDEALAVAAHHAERDGWPAHSPLRQCVAAVERQRAELHRLTVKRLGAQAQGLSLVERLALLLDRDVVNAPRVVVLGQRWQTAKQVLVWPSVELEPVAEFGRLLEAVVSRPRGEQQTLLFSLADFDALAAGWSKGVASLERVWQRLDRIDERGVLSRYLKERSRRLPKPPRSTGPDVLLHAEFWRRMAEARFDAVLAAEVAPVVVRDAAERLAVIRWVWQRERAAPASVETEPNVSPPPRAALLALAHAVAHFSPTATPSFGDWHRWAIRADEHRDEDWARLRDALTVLVRVLDEPRAPATPPLYRQRRGPGTPPPRAVSPERLAALVTQLEQVRRHA